MEDLPVGHHCLGDGQRQCRSRGCEILRDSRGAFHRSASFAFQQFLPLVTEEHGILAIDGSQIFRECIRSQWYYKKSQIILPIRRSEAQQIDVVPQNCVDETVAARYNDFYRRRWFRRTVATVNKIYLRISLIESQNHLKK